MRILFTFAGGTGHLEPLVPLARAAQAVRHTVAFAGRPWMRRHVEALGFDAFDAGSDVGLAPQRRPLAPVDLEREVRAVGAGFGRRIAGERAADLLPLCESWRPDLLVCDELDFGAMVVAERLGLPHATVLVIAAGGFVRPGVVAPALDLVRAEHGLAPDPALAMPRRHLVLSPFPPSVRDPTDPLPPAAFAFRSAPRDGAPSDGARPAVAAWLARPADAPLAYFTLGTVFNVECGDLYQRVLAGLRELPLRVLVTVGRDVEPSDLGPQPEHVHVERFVPQALILPHCNVVVSHGGSGSVLGALTHGLPLVVIPMGADQPLNAARCVALGAGRALDAVTATPGAVRDAVVGVLEDDAYRRSARRLRDEIAALPDPARAVERLAALR